MLHNLPDLIRTPLAFIVVLGILVSVHEYGHYIVARMLGFRVEAFAIGFGKPIFSRVDRHGTSWQVGWLPLGGFVRLHGFERPEMMEPEARAALRPGEGFHDRPVWRRAAVTIAGPAANFLLTLVLFSAMFMAIGRPVATPVLGAVQAGQPAALAGLRAGDRVLAVDGHSIDNFLDLQKIVLAHPDTALQLRIARGGARDFTVSLTTGAVKTPSGRSIGHLGVASGAPEYRPVGPLGAIYWGGQQSWMVVAQTAQGLWQVISGQRGVSGLGGTLRIAQLSGQVAKLGFATFVEFIAVLSVNLGLLNLLPIPVLDGGHLVFYAIEGIRGRPLAPRTLEMGLRLGFGLIVTLVALSVVNDLTHFGLFRWMAGRI
jgi:regulator of sigma E protease